MTQFKKRWHSSLQANTKLFYLAEKVGYKAIDEDPRYEKAKDSKMASIAALVLARMRKVTTFFRIPKNDPPDAFLMQPSPISIGTMDISSVEFTEYSGRGHTLLEQLKKTKIPENYHIYSDEYILLIELRTTKGVNYKEINQYLQKTKTPFAVWTIRQIEAAPDTIAEIVIIDDDPIPFKINLGQDLDTQKEAKIPDIVISKRVGDIKNVRVEPTKAIDIAPWEDLED